MNIRHGQASSGKKGRRKLQFAIDKRQKFVLAVIILSLGLFFTEYQLTKWGLIVTLLLPFLTVLFLGWAVFDDLKENKLYQIIILPFIYTFAFGFFYLLTPTSFFVHLLLTAIYAFGVYSLFLSHNIFF